MIKETTAILQPNTEIIAKTTQTAIGVGAPAEIGCGRYSFITLFLEYTNGDETGLDVQAHFLHTAAGTEFQDQSWTVAAGTRTVTLNEYRMTASGDHLVTFDIRGIAIVKFTQGGSNNDGTPTGTLGASYTMTGG